VGSTRCIEIAIIDDIIALENDESFNVDFEFSNGMGVSKGAIPQTTVIIIDNDGMCGLYQEYMTNYTALN